MVTGVKMTFDIERKKLHELDSRKASNKQYTGANFSQTFKRIQFSRQMRISLKMHSALFGQFIHLICLSFVLFITREHKNKGFNDKMETVPEINKEFGQVLCGKKTIESVKIRNTSKKAQIIAVVPVRGNKILYERLRVSPQQAVAQPGKPVRFTLTYLSNLEGLTETISYDIYECEKQVARLNVHATTLGPCLSSKIYNVKFFRFRDVNQTIRNVTLENVNKCEAKFYFDIDEDYKQIQISQTRGIIPAESKLCLKMFFNSSEPGVHYKRIFCLIQYHPPLIFNVLSICQPKLKLEPNDLNLRYPMETRPECNYAAYMEKLKIENSADGEKIAFSPKCVAERECLSETTSSEVEGEICQSAENFYQYQLNKHKISKSSIEVFLTTCFVDIKNQPETFRVTTLVNFSKCHRYYYEWDKDPNDNFQIHPDRGVIEPNMKTYFNVYFSPSDIDSLYHVEIDLRIFPYDSKRKTKASNTIILPLTQSLRIIGNSFPDDSCGWMAQCTVVPKTLQLRSCVPEEYVYGTFMIERRGHLPVSFNVIPSKEMTYFVQPCLGYLSEDSQLFVIEFNGKGKEEGVHSEDLKIVFNNTERNCEIIKVATSVEIPKLIFGDNNSHTFKPVFPGARTPEAISIKNPTNLTLSYEFKTSEDMNWCEVVNPNGVIEPNSLSEVTVVFKPETPCRYLGFISCWVSSISKIDFVEIINVQLTGSCEYGYLVATPSIHDYGECPILEKKSVKIHLFNFSPVLLHFQLTAVHRAFPVGNVNKDVIITPNKGTVPGKCSTEVEVAVIPHNMDTLQYAILCQNLENDSEDARICDEPRTVFSFRFEGVLPSIQIIDLSLHGAGDLFSSHWLWKMLDINKLNYGFNSLEPEVVVNMNFPEAPLKSHEISVAMLLETNKYGDYCFKIHKKTLCPCYESSDQEISTACTHPTLAKLVPNEIKLRANKRAVIQFYVTFQEVATCSLEWTLILPHMRKIILRAKVISLPNVGPSCLSMYLNPVFRFKPVFIGDINPPLQLFWLYNNTNQPAEYSVVNVTLLQDVSSVQRIIDCINPNGVIPPFSSLPLGLLFTPNEIRSYLAQVMVRLHKDRTEFIIIGGEGVPNIQQNKEVLFEKTIPKVPSLYYSKVDVHCETNYVDIKCQRIFSKVKRIFFVHNVSKTSIWSFRWHTFKVANIIFAWVQPSEGRIEPGKKILMTLTLESFSYPTTISFSIPCDVINYSQLKAYEEAVRLQEIMTEKAKDYFTITDKGITYEKPDIEIPEKPALFHIFISVNANIFTTQNAEMKIRPDQQSSMKAANEMEAELKEDVFLKTSALPPILQVFEKSLWNIINNANFWKKIECSKKARDFKYLQLLPESRSKRKQGLNATPLQRGYIQSLLEKELREMLSSNFICSADKNNKTGEL